MELKRELLKEQWNIFFKQSVADGFPIELKEEAQYMFYAGAYAIFYEVQGKLMVDEDLDFGQVLDILDEEFKNYKSCYEEDEVIQ